MATCTITTCRRPLRPDEAHRTACYRCEHRIRAWLHEITKQWPLLEASLQRDTGPKAGNVHGSAAHSPAPVRIDVLSLIGPTPPGTVRGTLEDQTGPSPILAVLQDWAQHTATGRGTAWPKLRRADDCTTYLAAHLAWACTRPWVAELHRELGQLIDTIRRITHTQPRRRRLDAPCQCGAFGLDEADWSSYIECRICGRLYTQTEYRDHAAEVLPPLYRIAILMTAAKETIHDDDAA